MKDDNYIQIIRSAFWIELLIIMDILKLFNKSHPLINFLVSLLNTFFYLWLKNFKFSISISGPTTRVQRSPERHVGRFRCGAVLLRLGYKWPTVGNILLPPPAGFGSSARTVASSRVRLVLLGSPPQSMSFSVSWYLDS